MMAFAEDVHLERMPRDLFQEVAISPRGSLIQVDIGGHPPFPTGPKHVSGNFGNLLFLAVFSGPELPGPF
jgi:hypothetical protein